MNAMLHNTLSITIILSIYAAMRTSGMFAAIASYWAALALVFRRQACEPPYVMVDHATILSRPFRIANGIRFRSKWSKNDLRMQTLCLIGALLPNWPTTVVATVTKMGNNGTKNLSDFF